MHDRVSGAATFHDPPDYNLDALAPTSRLKYVGARVARLPQSRRLHPIERRSALTD